MKTIAGYGFFILLAVLLVLSGCPNASGGGADPDGPSGSLDTSFGTDGKVTTDFSASGFNRAGAFSIHSNGTIAVAGSCWGSSTAIALAVYSSNGVPFNSFDDDGSTTMDLGLSFAEAKALTVQSDGKIIIAGNCGDYPYDYFLVRMHTDGTFDTSFGTGGMVITDLNSGADYCNGVVLQSDGKIIAAGRSFTGSSYDFSLARYNSDGSLDTSFDSDGIVTTPIGSNWDYGESVAIQSNGKILLAGYSDSGSSNLDFALARYNSDGSLDTGFDSDGIVTTDFGSDWDQGYEVAIQDDGKILLAGSTGSPWRDFALARYNSDGSLDTGFDSDGKVTTDFGSSDETAYGITLQSDGKILVTGYSSLDGTNDFALARYNPDGSVDTGFANDGKVVTDFEAKGDEARCVVIQTDGKIVVAGMRYKDMDSGFALARYWP